MPVGRRAVFRNPFIYINGVHIHLHSLTSKNFFYRNTYLNLQIICLFLHNNIMVCKSSTTEEQKPKSCCSGKKVTTPDNSAIPQERAIAPIKKGDGLQETGCECCVKRVDPDPSEGPSFTWTQVLIVDVDDGRPQPVTTNFRCACGTFRGCCWGTCYPGCKCPGM